MAGVKGEGLWGTLHRKGRIGMFSGLGLGLGLVAWTLLTFTLMFAACSGKFVLL